MRSLYGALVLLHPPEFRQAFGDQMLSIYDEMSAANAASIRVYFDAVTSLARQWIVRCGLWKPAVSLALSALLFRVPLSHPVRAWAIPRDAAADLPADVLVKITLLTLGLISVILIAIVSWSEPSPPEGAHLVTGTTCGHEALPRDRRCRKRKLHRAPGEVTGYLGPNGSGKSTTLKMIIGLIDPAKEKFSFETNPSVAICSSIVGGSATCRKSRISTAI